MVQFILPANTALTERSRKFYDGTYRWDAEGFTDDSGVYRAFDCYDHAARAPTPLPCMSFGDETDEEVAKAWEQEGVGKTFASASEDKREGGVTVRSDDLVRGYANRERLLGKMEGVIIASRANNVDLSLEECYRLCGIPDPVAKVSKRGITPPSNPLKKGSDEQKTTITPKKSPPKPSAFSPSELSDCPSDISEWDESKRDSKVSAAPPRADSAQQEDEVRQKPTTGGVAQKVKKAAKKPATKTPQETAVSRVAAPDLGSSMKGPKRRSSRLGNAPDK